MRRITIPAAVLALPLLIAGCGGDAQPVDVNGTYNLNVTNGPNGCANANYTEGMTSMLMITVTQNQADPTRVSVTITNALLEALLRLVGIPTTLAGTVNGNKIDATGTGAPKMEGTCMSQPQLRIQATLDKNTLEGTATWSFVTNKSADCGLHNTCATIQSFNGIRPLGGN